MNILVLGSAFDPPQNGHADTIHQQIDNFDQIILVPSYDHPFGKKMRPFEYRMELTHLFAKQFTEGKVLVSRIEESIHDGENPVYTYHVLNALQKELGDNANLSFMIGPDNEENFHKFYNHKKINDKWDLVVAQERVNVRSSKVRPLITRDAEHKALIATMVSPLVCNAIFENIELWVS
jgi:nicotinate-nucleotide adenylyltransferase